jgi:hypothetical protein
MWFIFWDFSRLFNLKNNFFGPYLGLYNNIQCLKIPKNKINFSFIWNHILRSKKIRISSGLKMDKFKK